MPLLFKSSDGANKLPSPYQPVVLTVDECVHEEIVKAKTPDMWAFLAWRHLALRHGTLSASMFSIAMEHTISTRKERLDKLRRNHLAIVGAVLDSAEVEVTLSVGLRGESEEDKVLSRAVSVMGAATEIAWLRSRGAAKQLNQQWCLRNVGSFMAWRDSALSFWPHQVSTVLAMAAIAGNRAAHDALKLDNPDLDEIRNGAFDAIHLEEFSTLCSPKHLFAQRAEKVAVFVTSDRRLAAAIDTMRPAVINGQSGTALVFQHPWLPQARQAEVRYWMLTSGPQLSRRFHHAAYVRLMVREIERLTKSPLPKKLAQLQRAVLQG